MQDLLELQQLLIPAITGLAAALGEKPLQPAAPGAATDDTAEQAASSAAAAAAAAAAAGSGTRTTTGNRSWGFGSYIMQMICRGSGSQRRATDSSAAQATEALRMTADLLPELAPKLAACGEALAALCPVPLCCNNPGCVELREASELQLVAGKGSVCSRCRWVVTCLWFCGLSAVQGVDVEASWLSR
jgi:hypothetical protein